MEAVLKVLPPASIMQYQKEERALMKHRVSVSDVRVHALLEVMRNDHIAAAEHVQTLAESLSSFHGDERYKACNYMGELVHGSIMNIDDRPTVQEVRLLLDDDQADEGY